MDEYEAGEVMTPRRPNLDGQSVLDLWLERCQCLVLWVLSKTACIHLIALSAFSYLSMWAVMALCILIMGVFFVLTEAIEEKLSKRQYLVLTLIVLFSFFAPFCSVGVCQGLYDKQEGFSINGLQ